MKTFFIRKAIVLMVAFGLSAICLAEPMSITTGPNGGISFPGGDISIVAFGPGWSTLPVREDTAAIEEEAQNLTATPGCPVEVLMPGGASAMNGRATWTPQPDGTVRGDVFLECLRQVDVQCLALDASVAAVPDAGLGDSVVGEYVLPAAGGRTLRVAFDAQMPVHAQDSRQWGGSWNVRFGDNRGMRRFSPGDRASWHVVLSDPSGEPLAFSQGRQVEILPGDRWAPLDYRKDITPGSALDFSGMGFQDAPAGKHGWLKAVGGHFEFEHLPGVEQRFYGVNLCYTANYPDHDLADILVDRLVRCGYNSLRIHHHDDTWAKDIAARDRLDYLIARAIEKGLYITTDLYVSRVVPWRSIGIDRDGNGPNSLYKAYVGVNDEAFRDWCEYSREFLEHVNPYTGRAYKDEPGMPLISLVNEGKLEMGWDTKAKDPFIQAAWREFCAEERKAGNDKGAADQAPALQGPGGPLFAKFDTWVNRRVFSRGLVFVRSLGCRALLTNDNNGRRHGEGEDATPLYDYVDSHSYVDHPTFPQKQWSLPSRCDNSNPIMTGKPDILHKGWAEGASKPYAITEWNFSGPGRYRGMGGILMGALAAQQGWDGLWRFAYSHSADRIKSETPGSPGYFDCVIDPLVAASDRASVCLFLRGDAAQASKVESQKSNVPTFDLRPLTLDEKRGSMAIVTERTCGGFAESGRIDAGPLSFEICPAVRRSFDSSKPAAENSVATTVWASSLDGAPVERSSRLLLVHLTDVQGEGALYADESRRLLLRWGRGCLMEKGEAKVELRLEGAEPQAAGNYTVFALDTTGKRIGVVPSSFRDGVLSFTVSGIYYEIVR